MIKYYSLFCGVFLADTSSKGKLNIESGNWLDRYEDKASFLDYLKKTYYENYVSNILTDLTLSSGVKHFSINGNNEKRALSFEYSNESIPLSTPYMDVFLFPGNIGVFALKVSFKETEEISYQKISAILFHIRNPESVLLYDDQVISVLNLVRSLLSRYVKLGTRWDQYIPQLKVYTIIEDDSVSKFNASLDRKLFEIAHILPIDSSSSSSSSSSAPSDNYYREMLEEKTINVFSNWKAIPLFDSFTRISCSFADSHRTWERDYFLIYIHCLYTKFQLYHFNSQFKNVLEFNSLTGNLKKQFIEFVNDYNLAYISYKFLPNLLYEAINKGLEVNKELEAMDKKIERLHQAYQEHKSKQINSILIIISLLSIASVIADLSQWLGLMGIPGQIIYSPIVAICICLLILALVVWLIKKT